LARRKPNSDIEEEEATYMWLLYAVHTGA